MTDNPPVTSRESARRSPEQVLKQAPVEPIHDDGVRVFTIGTALFVVGSVVLYLGPGSWTSPDWWLTVGLTGVGIGLIAIAYCVWRRNKRDHEAALGIPAPTA